MQFKFQQIFTFFHNLGRVKEVLGKIVFFKESIYFLKINLVAKFSFRKVAVEILTKIF